MGAAPASQPVPVGAATRARRLTLIAGGAVLVALVGYFGPWSPLGLAALAASVLVLLAPLRSHVAGLTSVVPALASPLLFLPQLSPAVWPFDFIGFGLVAIACVSLVRTGRRAEWDLHGAQWMALAFLLVPLLAMPTTVVSQASFLAAYKTPVLEVGLFLALPRLVQPGQAERLLWAFPFSGAVVTAQVLLRMRGVDVLKAQRLDMRGFNTALPWGASNYIAAVLILCALGTGLVAALHRRPLVRAALIAATGVMVLATVRLYSRGASVALALALLVYALGLGRRRGLLLGLASLGAGAALIATRYGQVLATRFTDPVEYASWAARIAIWKAMWARFLASPWTGIGLNQGRYQSDVATQYDAHNIVLQFLSEEGIAGGILVVVVIVLLFRLVFRLEPSAGAKRRDVRLGALALLVAVLANGMVEPTLSGYAYGLLFVFFAAWLRAAAAAPPGQPTPAT